MKIDDKFCHVSRIQLFLLDFPLDKIGIFCDILDKAVARKAVYARTVGLIFRWAMFPEYSFFCSIPP